MKRSAIVVLGACGALMACGGAGGTAAGPGPQSAASARAAAVKAPGEAKVGDRTRCPVSGEEFIVTDGSPHAEYAGKTYYFCCAGCVGKFAADPQKYLGKPGA